MSIPEAMDREWEWLRREAEYRGASVQDAPAGEEVVRAMTLGTGVSVEEWEYEGCRGITLETEWRILQFDPEGDVANYWHWCKEVVKVLDDELGHPKGD